LLYLCRVISQSKISDKQEKIWSAALKLFVEYGFHGTPTSRIAREAGVSNGTLFHYFKTKDELVVSLYIYIKEGLPACTVVSGFENSGLELKSLFFRTLAWAMDHRTEFLFIQQFHTSPYHTKIPADAIARQTRNYRELLQHAIDSKVILDLPVDLIDTITSSMEYGLFQYLITHELSRDDQQDLLTTSFDLLWNVLKYE
jgi:AcrR family transcriptional regulator